MLLSGANKVVMTGEHLLPYRFAVCIDYEVDNYNAMYLSSHRADLRLQGSGHPLRRCACRTAPATATHGTLHTSPRRCLPWATSRSRL